MERSFWDGKISWKRKIPPYKRRKNERVSREKPILDIPPIVIVEPVNVDIPLPVIPIHVDYGNFAR